ncbi:alpha/beta hydrolase [Parvibaculum sp.]|uniref:alpha/beta fold hydrolase n=1 Tax=Parvibaculum sp. TaxID=2024848 RepID=UPI001AFF563C|nr:alpha/beta hydrolase [Parvibaculum sp.]MBO6634972.1 alpha/beta hydrolase [Parvibaculum sp.]MBO6677846.1 alpha/beta hydrolase [Parvibaculum sp.]MBO6685473.1 alpha/beta hydrolase [Parvibaculum sp.]MBO6905538.1 alpha/beta hydrolase [Parvibaculum sp.]
MTFEPYEISRKDKSGAAIRLCGRSIGPAGGRPVVMLASLGRPGGDFDDVASALAEAGYRVTLPEPRGIGGSKGPMDSLTLHDLAEDVAAVIESETSAPVTLIGHAFGNRLARTTAADRPELVSRVVLLACGGLIEMPEKAREALMGCFDESLSPEDHIECVRYGFFAEGNDPEVWRGGWYRPVMRMQSFAVRQTPVEDWWEAGGQPILVVQALEDAIALPANAHDLKKRMGDRATLVELPNAGHAMLPEQPERIVSAIRAYVEEAG